MRALVHQHCHISMEEWKETFRAVVHGSLQSSAIAICVTTLDVMEGEGGLGPVVFYIYIYIYIYILIIVSLFSAHVPLPFHPSLTTTTTTVKLIVFQYNINTVMTGTIEQLS